jgi:ribA/ribD-fused uncharacterized protein
MATADELINFYKGRAKNPSQYSYSPEGDLIIYGRGKEVEKRIVLPLYRKPSLEEVEEAEAKRMEAIATAVELFETSRRSLRDALQNPSSSKSDILRLNREIEEADLNIQRIRFPLKDIETIESIEPGKILFGDKETRKMYDINVFISRSFTLQDQYVREGAEENMRSMPMVETALPTLKKPILLFEGADGENGFLSLEWPVVYDYNNISYRSAKHALLGELAREFKDDSAFTRIQDTEDPKAIEYTYEDISGATEESWNSRRIVLIQDVNREKFAQHPELTERLIQTGEAVLGAVIPDDTLLGIGLALENSSARDQTKWTGQNMLGKALEEIRTRIKEDRRREFQAPAPAPAPSAINIATSAVQNTISAVQDTIQSTVDTVQSTITGKPKRRLRIIR